MRPKRLLAILSLFWFLVLGWFVATPYLAVWSLERAAGQGDVAAIADHVDFPALRDSLQSNAAARIHGAASALPDNPLAQLGQSLATALAQTVVNAAVTPESVALLLHGMKPDSVTGSAATGSEFDLSMGYSAFSRFIVEARRQGSSDPPLQLVFTRSGLAAWRLSAVRDPTLSK